MGLGAGTREAETLSDRRAMAGRLRPPLTAAAQRVERYRNQCRIAADVAAWGGAIGAAMALRLGAEPNPELAVRAAEATALAAGTHLGVSLCFGLYRGRYRTASFDEAKALASVWGLVTGSFTAANALAPDNVLPLSVLAAGSLAALAAMLGIRLSWRSLAEWVARPEPEGRRRVVVFGAGDAGQAVIRAMLSDSGSPYLPVALLDDDPAKAHRRISGVSVAGTRSDVAKIVERYSADVLLVAVTGAGQRLVGDLFDAGTAAGVEVMILPAARELLDAGISLADVRLLSEADLLGRDEVEVDVDSIAGYLRGRRVLVTGAGGSIGSELCRQLHRFGPEALFMLDRDESALHAVQLSLEGRALLDSESLILADIRDADVISTVFERHRPHVVFHAAALKHLTLLERHPDEGRRTNVEGTANVLAAARRVGVEQFVNISTDKAANPTSVLGRTKHLAEQLTAGAARATGRPYVSVRFGNVLGSRGSVLPTFRAQIEAGGPLTLTDPDVTRYFMTIPEAVRLVLQAGAIGAPGEVLILDMGEPVRIADLARRLIVHSGRNISIVHTGLRPGEKLHEQLVGASERTVARHHPRILHATPMEPAEGARRHTSVEAELRRFRPAVLDAL